MFTENSKAKGNSGISKIVPQSSIYLRFFIEE